MFLYSASANGTKQNKTKKKKIKTEFLYNSFNLNVNIFKGCIIIAAGLAIVVLTKNNEYDTEIGKTTMGTTTSTIETTTEEPLESD